MNREIKFRAWWNDTYLRDEDYMIDSNGNIIGLSDYGDLEGHLKYAVVEQYTGLKDINGVEIYENDVIWFQSENPLVGKFTEQTLTVEDYIDDTMNLMQMIESDYIYNITVIGNIHDKEEK